MTITSIKTYEDGAGRLYTICFDGSDAVFAATGWEEQPDGALAWALTRAQGGEPAADWIVDCDDRINVDDPDVAAALAREAAEFWAALSDGDAQIIAETCDQPVIWVDRLGTAGRHALGVSEQHEPSAPGRWVYRDDAYRILCDQRIKLVSFWGEETNAFANPDTCCNGGGYFQPAGGAVFAVPGVGDVIVDYADTSCGDFGARWDADITIAATGQSWGISEDYTNTYADEDDLALQEAWNRGASDGASEALRCNAWQLIDWAKEAVELAAYGGLWRPDDDEEDDEVEQYD